MKDTTKATVLSSETHDITGRYEVSQSQLTAALKAEAPESIMQFDLKAAFPALLSGTALLPKLAERVWRRVLDESIAEYGGAYAHTKATTSVQLWLENLPAGAAKAKLPSLADRMKDVYAKAHAVGHDADIEPFFHKADDAAKHAHLSPEMAKLMAHGLTANPTPEIFDSWLTRTTQSLTLAQHKTPFAKDITDVVSKSEVTFQPVWACANEMLVGGWGHIKIAVPQASWTPAEPVRQDMITLLAECLQLAMLATKKIQAVGFLSLRPATLHNKNAMDLMLAFLGLLSPDVKKNLLIEIRGLPKGPPSPHVKTALEALAPHAKAFMLDTGPFSKDDFSKDIPKLYANGYDLGGMTLSDAEIGALIRKYAEQHKNRPQKMYIKGVTRTELVKIAKDAGYTYLTGTAIHAPEKFITGMKAFPIKT